jgi:hypothetical protein
MLPEDAKRLSGRQSNAGWLSPGKSLARFPGAMMIDVFRPGSPLRSGRDDNRRRTANVDGPGALTVSLLERVQRAFTGALLQFDYP